MIVNDFILFQSSEKQSSELYKHIQGDDDYDTHALDSATMEQSRDQPDFKRSFDDSDVDMEEHESDDHDDNDELAQIDNDDIMVRIKGFKDTGLLGHKQVIYFLLHLTYFSDRNY